MATSSPPAAATIPDPSVARPGRAESHWPELDALRGLAAILMIVNHAAVRTDPPSPSGLIAAAGFVGSFAPVLFFFLTGLGSGVQSARRSRGDWEVLSRAGTLLIADSFLWLQPGRLIGLDFLGFIGVSALAVHCLRRLSYGGAVAAALAGMAVMARFVIGPVVRQWTSDLPWPQPVNFLLGTQIIDGFSYPPAPWLAYPFAGYALGHLAARHRGWLNGHRLAVRLAAAALAGLSAAATYAFVARGAVLFRWGNVSLAFFVASVAAVGLSLTIVLGRADRPPARWPAPVSLDGVRSLAVVPLHFLLLGLADAAFGPAREAAEYGRNVALVVVGSLAAAALVPAAAHRVGRFPLPWGRVVRFGLGLGVAAAWVALASAGWPAAVDLLLRGASQLALGVLLASASRPPTAHRGTPLADLT